MSVAKSAFVAFSSIAVYAVVSEDSKSRTNTFKMSAEQLARSIPLQAQVYFGSSCFRLARSHPGNFLKLKKFLNLGEGWFRFEQFLYRAQGCRVLWEKFPATFPGMHRAIYLNSATKLLGLQATPGVCPDLEKIGKNESRYILGLAALTDKFASCLVGTPAEAGDFLAELEFPGFRKNAIQDIRNGRLFDRSAGPRIDPLRGLEIETFIFRGHPDPQRSLEILDEKDFRKLLPRLSVIIDESEGISRSEEISSKNRIPVFRPFEKKDGKILGVWSEAGHLRLPS